jgi:hypothetical protein
MKFYAIADGMGRTRRHVDISLPLIEAIGHEPHYQPPREPPKSGAPVHTAGRRRTAAS